MEKANNLFSSVFKEEHSTPDSFQISADMKFVPEHQASFSYLSQIRSCQSKCLKQTEEIQNSDRGALQNDQQELMELKIQLQLRRYTSFQNGFMENHRKVLNQSVENFLACTNYQQKNKRQPQYLALDLHVTQFIFNHELFNDDQIKFHKERFNKNIDDYKILKQIITCLNQFSLQVRCQLVVLACYIEQTVQNIIQNLRNPNITQQLQKTSLKIQKYLNSNEKIKILKQSNLNEQSQSKGSQKFRNCFVVMCQSWIYTLLIAKLGYFQNECFDFNVRLEEYCDFHLLKDARGQQFDSDLDDNEIFSVSNKRIKF